jgi:SAM-dependent methyltransferase
MSRVLFAANILAPLRPRSVLDIGCRDCELSNYLNEAEYHGADLVPGEKVTYIGDITQLRFDRTFDTVVACDILEHLDNPSSMFDRIVPLASERLLISLPNTYDLKSISKFLKRDMGGKYRFTEEHPEDRHRWIMSREEIVTFAEAKAEKHGLRLQTYDMTYGSGGWVAGKLLSAILPRSLTSNTVFALFSR